MSRQKSLITFLGIGIMAFAVLSLWLITRLYDTEQQIKVLRQSMKEPRIEVVAWSSSPVEVDGERIPIAKMAPIFAVKVGRIDSVDKAETFVRKSSGAVVWEKFSGGMPEYSSGESTRAGEIVYPGKLPFPLDIMSVEDLALITSITVFDGNLIVELKSDITPDKLYWFSGNVGCLLNTGRYC